MLSRISYALAHIICSRAYYGMVSVYMTSTVYDCDRAIE